MLESIVPQNMESLTSSGEPKLKKTHTGDKLEDLRKRVEQIATLQAEAKEFSADEIEASIQDRLTLLSLAQNLFHVYPTSQLQVIMQALCRSSIMFAQQKRELLNDRRLVAIALAYQKMFVKQDEIIAYYEAYGIGFKTPEFYYQAGSYYELQRRNANRALHYYTLGYNNCDSPQAKASFKASIKRLKSSKPGAHRRMQDNMLFIWTAETAPRNLTLVDLSIQLHAKKDASTSTPSKKIVESEGIRHVCRTLPLFFLTYQETDHSFISPEEQHLLDIHMCFIGRLIARKQMECLNPYSQLANDTHIISRMVYTLSPRRALLLYTSKQGTTPNDLIISSIIEPYYLPRAFYFALVKMAPSLRKERVVLTFIEEVDTFPANPNRGSTLMICPYQSLETLNGTCPVVYPQIEREPDVRNVTMEIVNGIDEKSAQASIESVMSINNSVSESPSLAELPHKSAEQKQTILMTLTDLLGSGAFGKVFAAEALQSSRPDKVVKVAVKFFTRKKDSIVIELGGRAICAISTSFLREIYSLAALTLRLADSLNDCLYTRFVSSIVNNQGLGAFVMEYIPGITLFELCKYYSNRSERGLTCLPEDVILWLSYLMIKTVKTLHEAHIVHTDIKVDNWLVTLLNERSFVSQWTQETEDVTTKEETVEKKVKIEPDTRREKELKSLFSGGREEFIVPVACDFGKAIDASLFTINDIPVHFHSTSMSVVTPCPIVVRHWLYEPDYSGIASCIWYMIMGFSVKPANLSLRQAEKSRVIEVILPSKRYWKHANIFLALLTQLFNFTTEEFESYSKQLQCASNFTSELLHLIEPAIDMSEVLQFTRKIKQDKVTSIMLWQRTSL